MRYPPGEWLQVFSQTFFAGLGPWSMFCETGLGCWTHHSLSWPRAYPTEDMRPDKRWSEAPKTGNGRSGTKPEQPCRQRCFLPAPSSSAFKLVSSMLEARVNPSHTAKWRAPSLASESFTCSMVLNQIIRNHQLMSFEWDCPKSTIDWFWTRLLQTS